MKLFEQCLKGKCEQLKFRYQQTEKMFQRAYLDYTECCLNKLSALGDLKSLKSNYDNNVIIGGGEGSQNTNEYSQQQLSNISDKLIQIYQTCYEEKGKNLVEMDSYKDCQVNCLEEAIKLTQKEQSSSSLSFNLILVIVLSLIGFAMLILVLYKCAQQIKKRRDHKLLSEFDDQNQQCVDDEDPNMLVQKQHIYQAKLSHSSNSKLYNKKRLNVGLQRLDVNKMKHILNNLKQQNPDTSFEKADNPFSHQQSEIFQGKNFNHISQNQNNSESSNFMRQFTKSNNSQTTRSENSQLDSQQKSVNTNNNSSQLHQFDEKFQCNPINSQQDKSINNFLRCDISSYPTQPTSSPQFQALEQHKNLKTIYENAQNEQQTSKQIDSEASEDRSDLFSFQKRQGVSVTSPCEPQDKKYKSMPRISLSQRNIEDNNQQSPDIQKKKFNTGSNNQIQVSPIYQQNLETQEFAQPSPQYLQAKSQKLINKFKLEKDSPPQSIQELSQKLTQANESSSEEADYTNIFKQNNGYQNTQKNNEKSHNYFKSKSMYEDTGMNFNQINQNETVV